MKMAIVTEQFLGSFRAPGERRVVIGGGCLLHLDNAASSPVWPHGDGVPASGHVPEGAIVLASGS